MARPVAADYNDKRRHLLKTAAHVFAREGYHGASMAMVANEAGISKANLYHYCKAKDDLLFEIIETQLQDLVDALNAAQDRALTPREQLTANVVTLIQVYRDADDEHKVQIREMQALSDDKRQQLYAIERYLVQAISEALVNACPTLHETPDRIKPITMSLFGMMNWQFMWFRENGAMTREQYGEMIVAMVLDGV
ncbi:MAG: TetR/AcrR family transcriptional regulator [Gammaproteobacteria bacterium]|nr:TetR/AcrR family transcriptional regulator [Gammaproteobacteria bacterium]